MLWITVLNALVVFVAFPLAVAHFLRVLYRGTR